MSVNGDSYKPGRVRHAFLGQVLHDEVDELQLAGLSDGAEHELTERLLGSLPVQPHQGADEDAQALALLGGLLNDFCRAPGRHEHLAQRVQVRGGQGLVAAQALQRQVVFMGFQELAGLVLELGQTHAAADAGQNNRRAVPHLIFKVGVNDFFLALSINLTKARSFLRADSSMAMVTSSHVSSPATDRISTISAP
jgi:hypothetical protein